MDSDKPTTTLHQILDKGKGLFDDIKQRYKNSSLFQTNICTYCGKPVFGTFYKDLYGHSICSSHPRRLCISCDAFCDSGAITIAEDKYLCVNCQKYHTTLKDAKEIIKMIRSHYKEIGLGEIERFHLEMVGLDDMKRLFHTETNGDILGLAIQSGKGFDIKVLRNLSHTAIAGVLAHELLHLWQYQRWLNVPLRINEGFCNLGSYEIYTLIKTKHAEVKIDMLMKDPGPIYGDGYRIVKCYYDKAGWAGVIKKMEGYGKK